MKTKKLESDRDVLQQFVSTPQPAALVSHVRTANFKNFLTISRIASPKIVRNIYKTYMCILAYKLVKYC